MKFLCLIFSAIFICGVWLQNSEGQDITGGAAFLKIGEGARAIALGGAFVAVADDASAGYWNPSGLAQLQGPVISLGDRVPVMDTDYASMVFASPIWKLGYLGLSAIYYESDDVTMYDVNGRNIGALTDREAAFILSYAYSISRLSVGFNTKFIYQDMSDFNTSTESDGLGADIAVLYNLNRNLTVGATFHSKYELTSTSDDSLSGESPLNVRAGVCYSSDVGKDNSLSFMLDFDQTQLQPLKLHAGTELVIYDILSIRAGLDDLYVETRDANIDYLDLMRENLKPTFGLGLKWRMGRKSEEQDGRRRAFIFDYALSVENLGLRSFFTLAYQF